MPVSSTVTPGPVEGLPTRDSFRLTLDSQSDKSALPTAGTLPGANLKIAIIHNFYQQPGGEDVVFEQERQLLERKGHKVIVYTRSNSELEDSSSWNRAGLLKRIVWAEDSNAEVKGLLQREKPDVVHIHNTFMVISPSIYKACIDAGVPTVQTLHNFRLLCPASTLLRQGEVCEECIEKSLLQSIRYGCYRHSRPTTAAVALMLAVHRVRGTWSNDISAYVALTEFAKQKFLTNGFPPEKIFVKPNFVEPDPGERLGQGD
jgi:glycosyltransferase involved in cell wall biosynthesis